jgi:hypothetical protein
LGKSLRGLWIIGVHVWVGASGKSVELSGVKMSQLIIVGHRRDLKRIPLEFCRRAVGLELENFIVV